MFLACFYSKFYDAYLCFNKFFQISENKKTAPDAYYYESNDYAMLKSL